MARIPLSPCTMMSRASSAVAPIRFTCRCPSFTHCRTVSAPVRVLPNPRPAWISQYVHAPDGNSCSGLAQNPQSYLRPASWRSVSAASRRWRSGTGKLRKQLACDRLGIVMVVMVQVTLVLDRVQAGMYVRRSAPGRFQPDIPRCFIVPHHAQHVLERRQAGFGNRLLSRRTGLVLGARLASCAGAFAASHEL